MNEMYIGVMSGTSLDGIDIVLCWIDTSGCRLLSAKEYSFDKELKKKVLHTIHSQSSLQEIGILDHQLGVLFANSINAFIQEKNIDVANIKAIGLHGQTLWHEPNGEFAFSMQLGDANIVSARTGIEVVADFRRKDIANGGQGAPFAPAFHKFMFHNLQESLAIVNIGGMANITFINDEVTGYDSGCGNVLMDNWIDEHLDKPYDKNGEWARSGEVNQILLREMLRDTYFLKQPPKSTGRELFNKKWLQNHLCKFPILKKEDVQATLLELTVVSISNELKKNPLNLVIVCGGGAKNTYLMQRLQEELKTLKVASSDEYDVNSDFLEAMAFAWLAYKRIHKQKVELTSITGARKDSILGAIFA